MPDRRELGLMGESNGTGDRLKTLLFANRRRIRRLERRTDILDKEVQEARRVNRRVAELTDIVSEVLLPAANRDDERLRERLEEYRKGL